MKSLNRRKHNSQEWMFSFAQHYAADFIFLTDCGTLFEQGCLLRLVVSKKRFTLIKTNSFKVHMKSNDLCVGCTGRQRVMSAADQDCEDEGLVEGFFRLGNYS